MWKILVGFVVFAALALFVLMKSGGNVDMSGEQHGTPGAAPGAGRLEAPAAAPAAPPASAASK